MCETKTYIPCQIICQLTQFSNEVWPDSLCIKPEVEQCVESESGKILKIKKIVHTSKTTVFAGTSGYSGSSDNKNSFKKPILKIYVG